MALTKVSPSLFQVSNNITSVTVGGSANTISLTFDSNGVITGATNNAVSVANTAITGNITSSQITSVANTQITGTITGSQISSNTLSNTVFQTGAVENYMSAAGLGFGMRNRIINGAMVFDQRNAGASISLGSSPLFAVDRFESRVTQGSGHTGQQVSTAPVGFNNSLKITIGTGAAPTAAQNTFINHQIEGFNFADLGWGTANAQTITVSFRVYSSLTGTFAYSIANNALNRSYVATYSIPVANTWTTISLIIPGDTSGTWIGATNGIGSYNFWDLGSGSDKDTTAGAWQATWGTKTSATVNVAGTSGATFYITGVQLEKGSTATSFDYQSYGTELALCQRYYEIVQGSGWSRSGDNLILTALPFKVTKRAVPTITYSKVSGTGSGTTQALVTPTIHAAGVYNTGNHSGSDGFYQGLVSSEL